MIAASELSPAAHARIRRQLALIPVYLWVVFSWTHVLGRLNEREPVRDFVHFYVQGTVAREHNASALYDMEAMAAMVPRLVPFTPVTRYPPVYGPQVSVFFRPIAALPFNAARNVWLAFSLVVYGICCYAVWKACPRLKDDRAMTVLLLAAAPALHFMVGFVQISALGLACVTAAFFALRANRPFVAGLAIGSLAYKPPLGLGIAFVLIASREWRIILGAAAAAAAQIAVGCLYWGSSILSAYVHALARVPAVATAMEPNRFHMHSWRAFFDLLRLPAAVSLTAYAIASVATALVALWCWRARPSAGSGEGGRLVLRYAALLVATLLVDPHVYAYDLVLLVPALMLLWDWVLAQPERRLGDVFPAAFRDDRTTARTRGIVARLSRLSFNTSFLWLVYVCYFSPLFTTAADLVHVQMSVLLHSVLLVALAGVLHGRSSV